ncbi:MAG: DNA methyltransferase [bacterium]
MLLARIISMTTQRGDKVLDSFAGSGTTVLSLIKWEGNGL